jgi:hypothetical protein
MSTGLSTYSLYGIEAILTDQVVEPGGVRVVEAGTGRVLVTQPAPSKCVQVRRSPPDYPACRVNEQCRRLALLASPALREV